jgi:hypothetical protein
MRVEFTVPASEEEAEAKPEPATSVGSATWIGGRVTIEAADADVRSRLERAFRSTPVVTDDASYRRLGTHGEVQIPPGDLEWFRAAALLRAPAETGMLARLVPGVTEGGYDPAAGYRRFEESIERLGPRP